MEDCGNRDLVKCRGLITMTKTKKKNSDKKTGIHKCQTGEVLKYSKNHRPAKSQQPGVYLEPKWLRCSLLLIVL